MIMRYDRYIPSVDLKQQRPDVDGRPRVQHPHSDIDVYKLHLYHKILEFTSSWGWLLDEPKHIEFYKFNL